jgi:two-component system, cell cycle sensor histidine kinase and response regulator CckA
MSSKDQTIVRVLNVEDSPSDAMLVNNQLTEAGYEVIAQRVETAESMRAALESYKWDIILCDYSLPQLNAISAIAVLKESSLDIPLIIISGTVDDMAGVRAMKAGARDYFLKSDLQRLPASVQWEIQEAQNRQTRTEAENARLRESEIQLRQAQKMDAIGRLAGGIAHDFNNLLTAINGYSDLALRNMASDNEYRRNFEQIKHAGERAASLTRQLLAFSRKQVLQPKILDLNTIVSDMENMLQRLIGEDVELCTALDPSAGNVKADPGQLEQVIMNLAVNARDAMPNGGSIVIETQNVRLDKKYVHGHIDVSSGEYVMLALSDTGVGMSEDTRRQIFDPFFTTKPVGEGTGLGLSTVYGIVNQSGGYVQAYSEISHGTTFKIYLPREDAACQDEEATVESQALLRGTETILLAEDEDGVRNLASEILSSHGYTVLTGCNGADALMTCDDHPGPIDLLVTDVIMPEMGGRELRTKLLDLYPNAKVLFISGYTDDAIVHHGILESGTPFLQKPFTPAGLARKVRGVLDAL